jgi:hypothetical protein
MNTVSCMTNCRMPKMTLIFLTTFLAARASISEICSSEIEIRNPIPFVCKLCTESYGDPYAESDTCRRPLKGPFPLTLSATTILQVVAHSRERTKPESNKRPSLSLSSHLRPNPSAIKCYKMGLIFPIASDCSALCVQICLPPPPSLFMSSDAAIPEQTRDISRMISSSFRLLARSRKICCA